MGIDKQYLQIQSNIQIFSNILMQINKLTVDENLKN